MSTPLTAFGYPGGKVRALNSLSHYLKRDFREYREPFLGGASVGLWIMQRNPHARYWLNELFVPVYVFWKTLREHPEEMVRWLLRAEKQYQHDTKGLYDFCRSTFDSSNELEMACKEWILRKLTWGGMADKSTYRTTKKFSKSAIVNLRELGDLLRAVDVKITNLDYSECLSSSGEDVFIFADPPYMIDSFLYGRNGELHRKFDHQEFSQRMKACTHDWLITYNDCDEIRTWFADYFLDPLDMTYTLRSKRSAYELIITNYELETGSI